MAGGAGQERFGFHRGEGGSSDLKMSESTADDFGQNPHTERQAGYQRAKELLNGELSGRHSRLTDYFQQHYGEHLSYSDFSHLLKSIVPAVTAVQLTKMFKNYQGKNE